MIPNNNIMISKTSSDELVQDNKTGLMWVRRDNGKSLNWYEAKLCAEELVFGGYKDWRLPSVVELQDLWDSSNRKIRSPFELTSQWVWSSTSNESDCAWCFYFPIGLRFQYPLNVSYNLRALFVRDLKKEFLPLDS